MNGNIVLVEKKPRERLGALVQPEANVEILRSMIEEYHRRGELQKFGLDCRRKLLVCGAPGTGRTFVARILAGELNMPLYGVILDRDMTARRLIELFEEIGGARGVYVFEEVEGQAGMAFAIPEVVLDYIRNDRSDSILIGVKQQSQRGYIEGRNLSPWFDQKIYLSWPDKQARERMFANYLGSFYPGDMTHAIDRMKGVEYSHAALAALCKRLIRHAVLHDKSCIDEETIASVIPAAAR